MGLEAQGKGMNQREVQEYLESHEKVADVKFGTSKATIIKDMGYTIIGNGQIIRASVDADEAIKWLASIK